MINNCTTILERTFEHAHEILGVIVAPVLTKSLFQLSIGDDRHSLGDLRDPGHLFIKHLFCQSVVQVGTYVYQKGWYRYISHEQPSEADLRTQRVAIYRVGMVVMALSRFFCTSRQNNIILLQWTASFVAGAAIVYISKKADSFLKQHVYPLTNYKLIQWPYKIALEVVRIESAFFALLHVNQFVFGANWSDKTIGYDGNQISLFRAHILLPLVEEFIFRGVVLNVVKLYGKSKTEKNQQTEKAVNKEAEKSIYITAILFGIAHLLVSHGSSTQKMDHVIHCTLAGINFGYLSENYGTLSLPFMAHSLNNIRASAGQLNMLSRRIVAFSSLVQSAIGTKLALDYFSKK